VDEPWPSGESYRDVARRVRSFLTDLSTLDGPILLIGHSATRMALDHLLTGRPLTAAVATPLDWHPGWCYPCPG
jgi:2,3-bisphosphoglycerate-dependent phosphoglycerate mutase